MAEQFISRAFKGRPRETTSALKQRIPPKGALTVRSPDGDKTAKAGEVIFLTKGTKVAYEAGEDATEVVYVTYPHWTDVHRQSEHAALLDDFHPAKEKDQAHDYIRSYTTR